MGQKENDSSLSLSDNVRVGDFLAGVGVSLFVSPFVTTIDKSVVHAASGKTKTIREGLMKGWGEMISRPHVYFRRKEFVLVFGVYTATFWAANASATFAETTGRSPETWRFLSTVAVNIPGSVLQDRMFCSWFSAGRKHPVPTATYGCFAVRDMMTCATSFSLPLLLAKTLALSLPLVTLALPPLIQCVSSPLHLMGLDLYNRQGVAFTERLDFIKGNYFRTTLARIGRIGPTFGIGSNLNYYLRHKFNDDVEVEDGVVEENESKVPLTVQVGGTPAIQTSLSEPLCTSAKD